MSTAPAFSPGPWTTNSASVGSNGKSGRECLYPQCSLHIEPNMPSSTIDGSRPRSSTILWYSASLRARLRQSSGVIRGVSARVVIGPELLSQYREECADPAQHLQPVGRSE